MKLPRHYKYCYRGYLSVRIMWIKYVKLSKFRSSPASVQDRTASLTSHNNSLWVKSLPALLLVSHTPHTMMHHCVMCMLHATFTGWHKGFIASVTVLSTLAVDIVTGRPCVDFLDDWTCWKSTYDLRYILMSIQVRCDNLGATA